MDPASRPLHIACLVTSPGIPLGGPSGSSRHVACLARALAGLGHRVSLCVARRVGDPEDMPGVEVLECPPRSPPPWVRGRVARERWQSQAFARKVCGALADTPLDLVYERYALFSEAGALLRRRLRVPWFLEVNAPLRLERDWFEGFRAPVRARRAERRNLGRADRLLPVSHPMAHYLREEVGVPLDRIDCLPNGIDPAFFRSRTRSAALASRLELEKGPVVGFAGSLKPWHGLDHWLEVLARVRRSCPEVQGLVVGDGPGAEHVRARTRQMGLGNVVRFTGHVAPAEMPAHLALMDLLLAPYPHLEPFYFCPLKVLEALAAGVPVITTDQGDLSLLVGEGGALVPPEDIGALVQAVEAGLSSPDQRQKWSQRARDHVAGKDWHNVASRIIALARVAQRNNVLATRPAND